MRRLLIAASLTITMAGLSPLAWGQVLTPGAAALGGSGTASGTLIDRGGNAGSTTTVTTTTTTTTSSGPRIHYPQAGWDVPIPLPRLAVEGVPIPSNGAGVVASTGTGLDAQTTPALGTGAGTGTADVDTSLITDSGQTPVFTPATENGAGSVGETATDAATTTQIAAADPQDLAGGVDTSALQPTTATTQEETTGVLSGATSETSPAATGEGETTSDPEITPVVAFQSAALSFEGLTAEGEPRVDVDESHHAELAPVVALMRAQPFTPLEVVAVLAQQDAASEEAKLLARQRILSVRRYLIAQGLSADNLRFVISSNSGSDAFANHVLIKR